MKAIWLIGRQSLQFLMKDKTAFIWFLIVPVCYIFIFGNAFSHGDPSQHKADLTVINLDKGLLGQRLFSCLKSDSLNINVDHITEGVKSNHFDLDSLSKHLERDLIRVLVIPDTFSSALMAGNQVTLEYLKKPDADVQASMTADMAVRKAYIRLLADMVQLKISGGKLNVAGFQKLDKRAPVLTVKTEYARRQQSIPQGFNQQVPAQIIQFTTLMLFIYAGSAILDEKRQGLLRRIKTTPISFGQIFLGKLLFIILLGLTQSLLILIIGRFAFNVYLGLSFISLLLVIITFIIAIGSIGLCLGFIIKNTEKMLGTAIILGLMLSALSGCWWPLEIMPQWMQKLGLFLPTGLALRALHMLISFDKGFTDILPYCLGLSGMALIFALIFGRLLKRYQEG